MLLFLLSASYNSCKLLAVVSSARSRYPRLAVVHLLIVYITPNTLTLQNFQTVVKTTAMIISYKQPCANLSAA